MTAEVETISPLVHRDADRVCIQFKRVLAECCRCRRAVHGNAHGPLVAYGLYCKNCCPCKTYQLTEAEERLIAANRRVQVDPAARAAQGGETLRRRWRDPAFRAQQEEKRAEAVRARQAKRDRRAEEWKAYEEERAARRAERDAA